MNQEELTMTFAMISSLRNPLVLMVHTNIFSVLFRFSGFSCLPGRAVTSVIIFTYNRCLLYRIPSNPKITLTQIILFTVLL